MGKSKKVPVDFYATPTGTEPVREWLKSLSKEDRVVVGTDIQAVEFGWPVGLPVCRPMGRGLWEVRSELTGGRTARVLFGFAHGRMVLLHGFIKKSRKTPASDLTLAQRRFNEVKD